MSMRACLKCCADVNRAIRCREHDPLREHDFLSAFLLFLVQPLIGKYLLPWFGGGAGVWNACLLFFQVPLLAGYAYDHAINRFLPPRGQAIIHVVLMLAAIAFLPIIPAEAWKPRYVDEPALRIVSLLLVCL